MTELDYRLILDAFADAVVAADGKNRIVYLNAAAEKLLGWSAGELVGKPLVTIIPPRLHPAHHAGFNRYIATRVPKLIGHPVRVPALRRDGSEVDVELILAAFQAGHEQDLIVGSLRDLRERVELERQISVTRYLRAATASAAKLGSRLDLDHVLQTVVETQVADFDAALARIWLYEADTNTLHLRASAGLSQQTAESSRAHIDVDTYPYKVGVVARTRKPFIKNGLLGDPDFEQDWVARDKIAAVAAFPLMIGGELHGVLVHFSHQPLPDELVEVLGAFVALVTTCLNDVELFTREQSARADAEAAQQRLGFLAEASALLASSLDYQTTLKSVARLAVPFVADRCVIDSLEDDGSLRRLAAAHADAEKERLLYDMRRRYPVGPARPHPVSRVLQTGEPQLVPDVTDSLLEAIAHDTEHMQMLRRLGFTSMMIVPLRARGGTLGALTLVSSESGRHYGESDLELAEDLAQRAALAVDNARLYEQAQEAIQARDEFLSIASHELKTPLTSLQAYVQMLLRSVQRGQQPTLEQLERRLEGAEQASKRLVKLINGLLDVSRISAGRLELELEAVDLTEVTREVAERFEQELAEGGCLLELGLEGAAGKAVGRWDRFRIEQVVTNLLANAIKYGPGKPIEVRVEADGGKAQLVVRDRGIGIAPEQIERIFGQFERAVSARHYGGLGLGLFIVRQIVEAHGGEIRVESRPREGSTFTVELPLAGAGSQESGVGA